MVKYYNFDIVFAEIPDETTLAINITNCPNRCKGCHSPHLREDIGRILNEEEISALLSVYGECVTCLCFMGGDATPFEIAALARFVKDNFPKIKTGWYSGKSSLCEGFPHRNFDYIKIGEWNEKAGPLNCSTTNQRLYHILPDGKMQDITYKFLRK